MVKIVLNLADEQAAANLSQHFRFEEPSMAYLADQIDVQLNNPVLPALLWGIEESATASYGYGGWLTEAVRAILNGETKHGNISEEDFKVAQEVAIYLEAQTPQIANEDALKAAFGAALVDLHQQRNTFTQTLVVRVKVVDASGDSRSTNLHIRKGDGDPTEFLRLQVASMANI
jgi:hypothetical protein